MRILAVDDEPSILLLLEVHGQRLGHEVVTCASAAEALDELERDVPDVLILDVAMPEVDGPTLLRRLRAEGRVPGHVFFSSAILPEDLRAVAAEFDVGFLPKPFTAQGLEEALAPALTSGDASA